MAIVPTRDDYVHDEWGNPHRIPRESPCGEKPYREEEGAMPITTLGLAPKAPEVPTPEKAEEKPHWIVYTILTVVILAAFVFGVYSLITQ